MQKMKTYGNQEKQGDTTMTSPEQDLEAEINSLEEKEITGEKSDAATDDTTPTQEEYEEQEDNKLKFTEKSDNPNDILYEDEY